MSTPRDDRLHRKAVELVRDAYDVADRMRTVNLEAINDVRPPVLRYHAQHEIVVEFVNRANAMLNFAGQLGLVTPEEDREIRRSIAPELAQWLEQEDKRLSGET